MVEISNSSVTEDSCSAVKKCPYGASIQTCAALLYYLFALVSFSMPSFFRSSNQLIKCGGCWTPSLRRFLGGVPTGETHVPFPLTLLSRGDSSNQTQLRTSAWCYATPENARVSSQSKSKAGLCSSGNSFALLRVEESSDLSWVLPHAVGPGSAKLESSPPAVSLSLPTQPAMQTVLDLGLLQYSTTERSAELESGACQTKPGRGTGLSEMSRGGCCRPWHESSGPAARLSF